MIKGWKHRSRDFWKLLFCHQKNNKKQTSSAWNFTQSCRVVYILYFKINFPFFCCPFFFQKYLNPQVRIDKMVKEHTVDNHPSPLELTSRIHPLKFLWTPEGFVSPSRIHIEFSLKSVYLTILRKKFQIHVIRSTTRDGGEVPWFPDLGKNDLIASTFRFLDFSKPSFKSIKEKKLFFSAKLFFVHFQRNVCWSALILRNFPWPEIFLCACLCCSDYWRMHLRVKKMNLLLLHMPPSKTLPQVLIITHQTEGNYWFLLDKIFLKLNLST